MRNAAQTLGASWICLPLAALRRSQQIHTRMRTDDGEQREGHTQGRGGGRLEDRFERRLGRY